MSNNDIITVQPKNISVKKSGDDSDRGYCMKNVYDHIESSYCMTEYCDKPVIDKDPCCDIFITLVCCPIKFAFVWPCWIGAYINCYINKCRKTNKNYLC